LISDNLIDGGVRGISLANFNEGGRLSVCSGNLIRNISATPPYLEDGHLFGTGIAAEADVAITGNTLENIAGYGLFLGWGEYLRAVVATSNIIRKTPLGIYVTVVPGAGMARIADNMLSQVGKGIVGYRWKDAVTDDLAISRSTVPANLSISNNVLSRA